MEQHENGIRLEAQSTQRLRPRTLQLQDKSLQSAENLASQFRRPTRKATIPLREDVPPESQNGIFTAKVEQTREDAATYRDSDVCVLFRVHL